MTNTKWLVYFLFENLIFVVARKIAKCKIAVHVESRLYLQEIQKSYYIYIL